jgi:hypothetical protein
VTRFEPTHFTYATHVSACRFGIVPFWTASECLRERAYNKTPGSDPVKILVA